MAFVAHVGEHYPVSGILWNIDFKNNFKHSLNKSTQSHIICQYNN